MGNADPELTEFWDHDPVKRQELSEFRSVLREKLLHTGVRYFDPEGGDLDGLHDDYKKAWCVVHGSNEMLRRSNTGSNVIHKWDGPSQ